MKLIVFSALAAMVFSASTLTDQACTQPADYEEHIPRSLESKTKHFALQAPTPSNDAECVEKNGNGNEHPMGGKAVGHNRESTEDQKSAWRDQHPHLRNEWTEADRASFDSWRYSNPSRSENANSQPDRTAGDGCEAPSA